MVKSGIYQILNTETAMRYIGSASQIHNRWGRHRYDLRNNKHSNSRLQRAWNKYGEQSFVFSILEELPLDAMLSREQWYLDTYWEQGLYNARRTAHNNTGVLHTPESREKMRAVQKAIAEAPPTEARLRSRKEHAERITGRIASEETRRKMSAARTGRKASAETKAKNAQNIRDRPPEVRQKCADALSREWLVTFPTGETKVIKNLSRFARENDLLQSSLSAVARGKIKSHRGYRVSAYEN